MVMTICIICLLKTNSKMIFEGVWEFEGFLGNLQPWDSPKLNKSKNNFWNSYEIFLFYD